MMQFAALFNDMTTAGAEVFATFLNSASSSDATRAGHWLNSATPAQVKEAAALLNQGNLDEFRKLIGIRQGFWGWLFGKRKRETPASVPVAAPAPAHEAAKPSAEPERIKVSCPKCNHNLKYSPDSAGKKAKCSKCGHVFRLASSSDKAAIAVETSPQPKAVEVKPKSKVDTDWQALVAYLRDRGPAEISTVKEASAAVVIVPYHEAVAADHTCPKLTYYLLKASSSATGTFPFFPYVVVATGELSEHNRAWNFDYESILKRVLPGKTWNDFTWEGGYSNHSKPGCQLASTAPFDRLADAIIKGSYQIDRVLKPGAALAKAVKSDRWNVQVFGDEIVRPESPCQICGDNRVAYGFHGSHLICRRCGAIYCRRNCQASIHGQCPRCGETDKIDGVSESDAPAPTQANKPPAGPIDMEAVIAELARLVGADNSGFRNKARIREIGEDLDREGGMELMRKAYYTVKNSGIYFSQDIWDGIGSWRC